MPWVTITVRRPRTFVPPEVGWLADCFRRTARQLRGNASDLRAVPSALEGGWQGTSHDRFVLDFGPRPGELESAAQWLETAAGQLERMEVTVWETAEEVVWVASTVGH